MAIRSRRAAPAAGGSNWALLPLVIGIAAVPLAIAPGMLLEHDVTPKLVLLLWSATALLLCGYSWWPGVRVLLTHRHGRLFAGLMAVAVLSLAASTAFSNQPQLSLAGSSWRRFGFVTQAAVVIFAFLCAAQAVARRDTVRTVLAAVSCCSGLLSAYAIAQYAGWDPLLAPSLYTIEYYNSIVRVPATLGHALYLGSFLAASFPIAIGLAAGSQGMQRQGYWLVAALSVMAIVLSGSRSAVLALFAGTLAYMTATRRRRPREFLVPAAVCAVLAVAMAIFLNTGLGAPLRHRMTQLKDDAYGGPRLLVWRDSLPMMAERPATGFGPEMFANEFRRRQSRQLSLAYPDYLHESPHNILIDTAFAQGIPGLVVLAGLMYLVFAVRSADGSGYLPALRGSAVAVFISLLFITVTITGALLLHTTVALIVAAGCGPRPAPRPAGGTSLVQPLAIGLGLLLFLAGAAYLAKDRAFARIGAAVTAHSFEKAREAYESTTVLWFPAPGDDLWASRQFATLALGLSAGKAPAAWAAAAAASARAELTGDDRADAAYQSAVLAVGRNDAAAAERKLRDASIAAPNWYKPHVLLAQLCRVMGRQAESDAETRQALDLAGTLRAEVERMLHAPEAGQQK